MTEVKELNTIVLSNLSNELRKVIESDFTSDDGITAIELRPGQLYNLILSYAYTHAISKSISTAQRRYNYDDCDDLGYTPSYAKLSAGKYMV